jgi:hypothetical protein
METIDTTGFLFTEAAGEWHVLTADFGDGYQAGALVGDPAGTRTWTIKIDVLPDGDEAPDINGLSRSRYLWQFFTARKALDNEPFWIEVDDQDDGQRKRYLAGFAENRLSYAVLCAKLYSTGLQLRQRRVPDVASPVSV